MSIEESFRDILVGIGEDPDREGLKETPNRYARAILELTRGYDEEPSDHLNKTFDAEGYDELIVVRDIPFTSLCEHHVLPFVGTASVAYVPFNRVVGLSKIPRCVLGYAARLQIQERLTSQVADAMEKCLNPKGVAVVVRAQHQCASCRGVRVTGAEMVTSAMRGVFMEDEKSRAEILGLIA